MAKVRRWFLIPCLALVVGCSGYRPRPGSNPFPVREQVMGSTYNVSVRMAEGNLQPICFPPGADNDIDCVFYYGWFEAGNMYVEHEGYRFLNFDLAFRACDTGMWAVGGSLGLNRWALRKACARALMFHRWIFEDPDIFKEEAR